MTDKKAHSKSNCSNNSSVSSSYQSESEVDNDSGMLFIKFLPKDKLLWSLWKHAKHAQYMYYCSDLAPELTLQRARKDVNYMIQDNRDIELTTYYGRLVFVDISGDYLDAFTYNLYNGRGTAERIITNLKIEELMRSIVKYYTFF